MQTDKDIPEIDLKIISVPVVAKVRKLKTTWAPEIGQDMEAFHCVDLFKWILHINGKDYINEKYKDIYKDMNLPIARIICKLIKKNK